MEAIDMGWLLTLYDHGRRLREVLDLERSSGLGRRT